MYYSITLGTTKKFPFLDGALASAFSIDKDP
jgi:hypothetical protein